MREKSHKEFERRRGRKGEGGGINIAFSGKINRNNIFWDVAQQTLSVLGISKRLLQKLSLSHTVLLQFVFSAFFSTQMRFTCSYCKHYGSQIQTSILYFFSSRRYNFLSITLCAFFVYIFLWEKYFHQKWNFKSKQFIFVLFSLKDKRQKRKKNQGI